MTEKTVLFICHEPVVAERLARDLQGSGETLVRCVAAVEHATSFGGLDEFGLILFYLGGSDDRDRVDELLWVRSTARRPVPVVALSDRYDETEALTFFRMGVSDYLSLIDHRELLPSVVDRLFSPAPRLGESRRSAQPVRTGVAHRTDTVSQFS